MVIRDIEEAGGGPDPDWFSREPGPNTQLGFEIIPISNDGEQFEWTFAPFYYPSSFTNMKEKKLDRHNATCNGETVSIENIKNREWHVTGMILWRELDAFKKLQNHGGKVDIISPLAEDGGDECIIKGAELGNFKGYDAHLNMRQFEYTIDLVSTNEDRGSENQIVTEIIEE